jgi:transposase-like protein
MSYLLRPSFDPHFREDAVAAWRSGGRTQDEVAKDLGIAKKTLKNWVYEDNVKRRTRPHSSPALPSAAAQAPREETPEQQIARLKHELSEAQRALRLATMDTEILKKAVAFFAKEKE